MFSISRIVRLLYRWRPRGQPPQMPQLKYIFLSSISQRAISWLQSAVASGTLTSKTSKVSNYSTCDGGMLKESRTSRSRDSSASLGSFLILEVLMSAIWSNARRASVSWCEVISSKVIFRELEFLFTNLRSIFSIYIYFYFSICFFLCFFKF